MSIFDRYILKNLAIATFFIAITLAIVVFLTQSLRFLELVIEAGASGTTFWTLTVLAMPKFFEVILPLALMAATLFTYNKLTGDSELIAIRAVGYDPASLARPAFFLGVGVSLFLLINAFWLAPGAISGLQSMRQTVKAQFSTAIFREGVFNQMGRGLTVYIRERDRDGTLHGVMIHDSRNNDVYPSTVIAKRGTLLLSENGYEVVVEDGSRQEYDPERKSLKRLNFNRYTIELPDSGPVRTRWQEPDERTIGELLNPDLSNTLDVAAAREFHVEIHRRIVGPLFAVVFTLIACVCLLIGPIDRRGQNKRIMAGVMTVVAIQSLYIVSYNLARNSDAGLILMWVLVTVPFAACLFILSGWSDNLIRRVLYNSSKKVAS